MKIFRMRICTDGQTGESGTRKAEGESDVHTIGYVFLWFVIPLLLVLGVDILIVRRRERKNEKRKQQQEVKE